MKRILRDHYEDTFLEGPYFNPALPDFLTLCMDLTDVVKVTQYLTRAEGYCRLREGENSFLSDAEPASMLLLVPQFVRREFLVEVEVIAATEP